MCSPMAGVASRSPRGLSRLRRPTKRRDAALMLLCLELLQLCLTGLPLHLVLPQLEQLLGGRAKCCNNGSGSSASH